MHFIIVDGSSHSDDCYRYTEMIRNVATVIHVDGNIGHGRGLDFGLNHCTDDVAVVFDSDIVMLRSPLDEMKQLMDADTYGVGWITTIGRDGFDFRTPGRDGHDKPIPYLHPYFAMINVQKYYQHPPFVHHGAPWLKTAIEIFDSGMSDKLLRSCPALTGHSVGYGINWVGRKPTHIRHDFGGTRAMNKRNGKREIFGIWER